MGSLWFYKPGFGFCYPGYGLLGTRFFNQTKVFLVCFLPCFQSASYGSLFMPLLKRRTTFLSLKMKLSCLSISSIVPRPPTWCLRNLR